MKDRLNLLSYSSAQNNSNNNGKIEYKRELVKRDEIRIYDCDYVLYTVEVMALTAATKLWQFSHFTSHSKAIACICMDSAYKMCFTEKNKIYHKVFGQKRIAREKKHENEHEK